ncbi:MAG TPA: CAP domain-containing protein, partial [Candidatus Paceibacterota bacterium]|nr:CAP domain-containing protein [Candidatus Paceibacterota bacterium]
MKKLNDLFHDFKDHFIPNERNVYRPHILHRSWLLFFLTIALTAEGVFLVDLVARQSAVDFLAAVLPAEVIALTNSEREGNGLQSVRENPTLAAAAQAKAQDMAVKGYFSHVGPDGKEPWTWMREAGYNFQYAGENLAVRFNDSSEVVKAWMESPSHRANIVKAVYTDIGIGVAQGTFQGHSATFVVQYFGTPTGTRIGPADRVQADADLEPGGALAQVEGAQTPVNTELAYEAQPQSPLSSFARELVRGESEPSMVVFWILGAVAAIMIAGLALAFFIHIQIQPTDMLVGGTVVAV